MPTRKSVVVSVSAACLLAAPIASPCSPEPATRLVRLPAEGAGIPRNLVRFRVLDKEHAQAVSLRTANGRRVATHVNGDMLTTVVDPEPGELLLTYPVKWRNGKITSGTYRFTVLPAAPLELRRAELTAHERGLLHPDSPQNQAAFVRLRYDSPDANGNAAHLLEDSVTIDGRRYQFDFSASGAAGVPIVEIKSLCNPTDEQTRGWAADTCSNLYSVPQGAHTITVSSHVLGERVQPKPVSKHIVLSCANAEPGSSSPQPASVGAIGAPPNGDVFTTSTAPARSAVAGSSTPGSSTPGSTGGAPLEAATTLTAATSDAAPAGSLPSASGCQVTKTHGAGLAAALLVVLCAAWGRRWPR